MDQSDIVKLLSVGEGAPVDTTDGRVGGLHSLVRGMGPVAPDKDAPVREVVARLGDNWSALILKVLATGEFRHATLKRVISALAAESDISQRMLTLRLRALERDGFVSRRTEETVPPRVFYALTPLGQDLERQLTRLIEWIEGHDAQIRAAREAFTTAETSPQPW
jgi:DNA-binding HxlR family transcriptional regulator